MSGIAGIFHADGRPADPSTLQAMTLAMAHRGPDGIAHWYEGPVALGHCQLHSTTESLEEHQPLASEDGAVVLALDGYLANYDELRADLLSRGARLRNRSDAELVLHAYTVWGEDCPSHLDGEYAFVVWDRNRRSVFCARDHQGLRPLLYHWDGKTLLVASDPAAILAALPERPALDTGYLAEFLTCQFYSAEATIWHGVTRLRGAHCLVADAAGPRTSRYWALPVEVTIRYRRDEDYFAHYRAVLDDCLRRAARSHRPIACEVSGGLDSSALYCLAHHLEQQGRLPAPGMQGYTMAGPAQSHADEVAYARAAASHIGRTLRELPLFMPKLEWFTQLAAQTRDLPPYTNSAMAINQEQALVADGSRACINGLGGDQWLSGSWNYYQQAIESGDLPLLFDALRRDDRDFGWRCTARALFYFGLTPALPLSLRQPLRRAWRALGLGANSTAPNNGWLTLPMQQELAERKAQFEAQRAVSPLVQLATLRIDDPEMTMSFDSNNRQAARAGYDMRHPMLSRTYAEFSTATPEHIRSRGKVDKYVHRKAMAEILPPAILERSDKAEFTLTLIKQLPDINHLINCDFIPGLTEIIDPVAARTHFKTYCNATIDSKIPYDVWGFYLVHALFGIYPPRAPIKGSCNDQQS